MGEGVYQVRRKPSPSCINITDYTIFSEQTALAGRIQKEVNCLPVDNADYKRIMDARAREAEKRVKPKTDYRPGLVAAAAGTAIVPGAGSGFNSFIVRFAVL